MTITFRNCVYVGWKIQLEPSSGVEMLTTQMIFDRYQEVRARFPKAEIRTATCEIGSLLDIANDIDAFVFDAFGVLNVGDQRIPGADLRLNQLRDLGCAIRILTNAASYDRNGAIAKFKNLGIHVLDDEIITSREATLLHLQKGHWGVIAADSDELNDLHYKVTRLRDQREDYELVDQFLFLSTADWTEARQKLLLSSMNRNPRRILIANADLAAPRDHGFSVEPGHFGHEIADLHPDCVQFFGKPFPEVYDMIERSLNQVQPNRIAMCGDTLHTDILGAAARGWRTVLVTQDGLFAGFDTDPFSKKSQLYADWRLARI